MSRSSTRCSPWLAFVLAACATSQSTSPPVPAARVEPPPPPRPLVPLSPATLELRDVNLGLERRLNASLQLVGAPKTAWASDQRRVWALNDTGEGRSTPLLELTDDSAPEAIVSVGSGWAVATGRRLSFFEGGQLVRSCDSGGRSVLFLAAAPKGGVITLVDGTPHLIARDAQCLQRWATDAVRIVAHVSADWVYGLTLEGAVVRLSIADGKPGGELKLSGRLLSFEHVAGDVLSVVTQEGDGKTAGTSATFLERVELSAWKVTTQPLGPQPNEKWRRYDLATTDQGGIVVAKEQEPAALWTVSSEGLRPLPLPELKDERGFRSSGYLAQVGPRLVVAAEGRLHFFDVASERLEGSVNLGRPISRVANVDGELVAETEKALFRIRGTSTPARASSNVAWLRARPFQPQAVAALTDGSEATGFEFVDRAVIELTFTRPIVLHKLALAVRHDRPELTAWVNKVKFCASEKRSECWEPYRRDARLPLLDGPTLTQGVVLELSCGVPEEVPADVGRRCRITELEFE